MKLRHLYLIAAISLAASAPAAVQNLRTYNQICDASAGIPLDEKHFVVGDDEGNILRVYARGQADPVRNYDLSRFLIGRKKGSETDLEGAARVGDNIYWISSHGRNKDGQLAPNRHRFFATRSIAGGKLLDPIGKPYNHLLNDILTDKRFERFELQAASKLAPKEQNGLNIEGLCAGPNGSLLIGFRNPIPHGKALLLPLLNPAEIILGQLPRFGEMIELDLGGRGVRDITRTGDKFLILGGQHHTGKDFALYNWDGKNQPQEIPGIKFGKLNPEGLFQFPGDAPGVLQVLSDDGGEKIGGKECKTCPIPKRRFRAGDITLPQ